MPDEFEGPSSSSLLAAAVAASPIAIGAGIGITNLLRNTPNLLDPAKARVSVFRQTTSDIISRAKESPPISTSFLPPSGTADDAVREAWRLTQQRMNPNLLSNLKFTRDLGGVSDVVSAIRNELQKGTSLELQRAAGQFRRNYMEILSQQTLNPSLPLPKFSPVKSAIIEANRGFIPADIVPFMSRLKSLGSRVSTKFYETPIPGRGQGYLQINIPHGSGGIQLNLPIADLKTGLMTEGIHGQVTRIASPVAVIDPSGKIVRQLSRHQYFMEEFTGSILPRIESGKLFGRAIKSEISSLYGDVFENQQVVNISPRGVGAGYAKLRSQQVDILMERFDRGETQSMFRRITETEFKSALRANQGFLFGGTSPTALAKGRASLFDISKFGITSGAMDWAARFEQGFREYSLSPASRLAIATRGLGYTSALTTPEAIAGGFGNLPRFRTLYVDPERLASVFGELGIGEGEALASKKIQGLMEWQRPVRKKLTLVDEDIMRLIREGNFEALKGRVIGTEAGGTLFTLGQNIEEISATIKNTSGLGDFLDLQYVENIRPREVEKFFGDIKALVRFEGDRKFRKALKTLGVDPNAGYEVIAAMDMLKKNKSAHNEQMIGSLFDMMSRKRNVEMLRKDAKLNAFLSNPVSFGRSLEAQVTKQGLYDHNEMILRLTNLGKSAELSPLQMSRAFGAVPFVTGVGTEALVQPGLASGLARLALDTPAYENIMGSIEPRAFLALEGGALGDFGKSVAGDIGDRLAITNPDTLITQQQLNKSIISILETKSALGAEDFIERLAGDPKGLREAFSSFVAGGGGDLKIGQGFGTVYIPGADTLSVMRPYKTPAGKDVYSTLYNIYENFVTGAARMYTDDAERLTPAEFKEQILLPTVQRRTSFGEPGLKYHEAPAGQGMGAITRGKLIGSRYLRGVTKFGDWDHTANDLYTIGVSKVRGKQMLAEMKTSGLYDKTAIREIEERFFTGRSIGGMIWRNPLIGRYSEQAIKIKMVRGGQADLVAISEQTVNVLGKNIKYGPLVGLAGDKDADIFSVMMLGPDHEKIARQDILAGNSEYLRAYREHQIKYQLMKTKRTAYQGQIQNIENMIAGSVKLGTVQRYIPKLSVELTTARAAVGRYTQGTERANAEAILEWLEQTPISAKHFDIEKVAEGSLGFSLDELIQGFQQGDVSQIREAMNQMLDEAPGKSILEEGIKLDTETAKRLGVREEIRGMDINSALESIVRAKKQFTNTGQSQILQEMLGRSSGMSQKELLISAKATRRGISEGRLMAQVSTAFMAVDNVIGAAGKGMRHMAKPLGIGFAAAIGLGAILSRPQQSVGPSHPPTASPNLNYAKAANRMKPTDMHPAPHVMGKPTAPRMLRQRNVRIAPPGPSPSVHVKARGNYMMNGPDISEQIRRSTGGNTSVNVNIRDHRSITNMYTQGNKI